MYKLRDAKNETLKREIGLRVDAMEGCIMPAFDVDELVRELWIRAKNHPDPKEAREEKRKVSRLYKRVLKARYNIKGMVNVDRFTPVSFEDLAGNVVATARSKIESKRIAEQRAEERAAERKARAQAKNALQGIRERFGELGAQAFIRLFERMEVKGVKFSRIDDEHANERASLIYDVGDGVERSVQVGTVRKWLKTG